MVADLEDVDEMSADGPARRARREVVGLAGGSEGQWAVFLCGNRRSLSSGNSVYSPRRASIAVGLAVDNMAKERLECDRQC